ncbi:TPA: hypothetical protein ACN976_004727 [Vibrio campbellii]
MEYKLTNNSTAKISDLLKRHMSGLPTLGMYVNREIEVGKYTFKRYKTDFEVGYFSTLSNYSRGVALLEDDKVWMTLSALEVESHYVPQHSAKGKVVIAGLGLGLITLSLLEKKAVKEIVVLEHDADLIEQFDKLLDGKTLKLWQKNLTTGRVKIFKCDCLAPLSNEILRATRKANYLWVDIWATLFTEQAPKDTKRLYDQIKPDVCDYWGHCFDLIIESGEKQSTLSPSTLKSTAKNILGMNMTVNTLSGHALQLYTELAMRVLHNAHKKMSGNQS